MSKTNIIIIGGGIVGLATAHNLSARYPELSITILEKENKVAAHQSGHNSGVLHSGIYYKPGSLKALNCRKGKALMEQFCEIHDIPYNICGKVIVATSEEERPVLHDIYERGQANGVVCEIIDRDQLMELEQHTAGIEAIHVPESGIVDYVEVCRKLAALITEAGNEIKLGAEVTSISEGPDEIAVETTAGDYQADYLINCAGLYSDRVTKMTGMDAPAQIIPFRGEYYELKPQAEYLCHSLIYPVPDPKFPFLGVHFTLMIDGRVECGPNAVLAFAREGYALTDFNAADLLETLRYPGFQKLAGRFWRTGMGEMWRSASKRAFVSALQKLVPEIREEHLVKAPAGIRAQALLPDGSMMDDFAYQESERIVNVINAPSPAATSSLAIGENVVDQLAGHMA
ncbi:MAG: L-2-hydroxyglutarate oxidase [Candidatus Promineifilaceae bacterium]|jgi:L-2-hydroxyglutarate oxidase LhgO